VPVAATRIGGDSVLDGPARAHTADGSPGSTPRSGGDCARAAEYDRERGTPLDESRRATGLAGRPRRLGDEAERAPARHRPYS